MQNNSKLNSKPYDYLYILYGRFKYFFLFVILMSCKVCHNLHEATLGAAMILLIKQSIYLFITEPAPSTSDEKPASEPMETDKPEPEPEPEVDASVEEVCVLSTLWVFHSSKIWNISYKKIQFYILFRKVSGKHS